MPPFDGTLRNIQNGTTLNEVVDVMPVTLTIKHVPDDVAEALRTLAASHHRSLQGELMAIIESVAGNESRLTLTRPAETHPFAGSSVPPPHVDNLLDELDAIVAGSHWGEAPLLTRTQTHDRALVRELDYQVQEDAGKYRR